MSTTKARRVQQQFSKRLGQVKSTTKAQRVQQQFSKRLRQVKYANLNAFISTANAAEVEDAIAQSSVTPSPLQGKTIAIKDNIATSTLRTTAASKILETYTSPFNATIVDTLLSSGAILTGKTNLDEFGMGSHSLSSFSGPVKNPHSRNGVSLSAGGSSGGSAVAVATGQCWGALGTDTGGSVRLPAAYNGVVGFKPSYGRLSRWGVIAYANSLDTVGTLTRDVADAKTLYDCLNRFDEKDPTALPVSLRSRIERHILAAHGTTRTRVKKLRIGIPREYNIASLSPPVKSTWMHLLATLQSAGHTLHPVSLPTTKQALSTYYTLAPAEASSNLAKYDGIRYGHRTEGPDADPDSNIPLFAQTRGEGFGKEVQRRILLGAYTLSSEAMDNYFLQAQRVRRLVQGDFDGVFKLKNLLLHDDDTSPSPSPPPPTTTTTTTEQQAKVDILITPTAPTLPPTLSEVAHQSQIQSYMNDVLTVPASLAGLPALSIPVAMSPEVRPHGEELESCGMQILGQFGDDEFVLAVGEVVEGLAKRLIRYYIPSREMA